MTPPRIPTTFIRKKAKILQELSLPDTQYSDKSPKGTVDEGIRELIDEVNAYEGLVTTSSCAGRISVFLEGRGIARGDGSEGEEVESPRLPGGKGGGEFLFVSHEPVYFSEEGGLRQFIEIFGGDETPYADGDAVSQPWDPKRRLVRFAFEPMILHVMTASLHHATPLLNAAINSGFRESGVQSLKNLHDPEACPMVAVRTVGLGLEAIVASVTKDNHDGPHDCQRLAPTNYITMLLKTGNERFKINRQRISNFRSCLKEAMALETRKAQQIAEWESPEERRQRKRHQGLRAKEAAKVAASQKTEVDIHIFSENDGGLLQREEF